MKSDIMRYDYVDSEPISQKNLSLKYFLRDIDVIY